MVVFVYKNYEGNEPEHHDKVVISIISIMHNEIETLKGTNQFKYTFKDLIMTHMYTLFVVQPYASLGPRGLLAFEYPNLSTLSPRLPMSKIVCTP